AGNPGQISAAKEQMWNSILGIALLMTSFIILRTINPELAAEIPSVEKLAEGTVWYTACGYPPGETIDGYEVYDDGCIYTEAPPSEANTLLEVPEPFDSLYYHCKPPAKQLLVWTYNEFNFFLDRAANGNGIVGTRVLNCGDTVPLNPLVLSFKTAYREPGVYFYLKDNCLGVSSYAQRSPGNIPYFDDQPPADQVPKSLSILNGRDSRQVYGVVLGKGRESLGECSQPFYALGQAPGFNTLCFNVNDADYYFSDQLPNLFTPKSMHIINIDKNIHLRQNNSVKLWSKDFVATLKQKAGAGDTKPIGYKPTFPGEVLTNEIGQYIRIPFPDNLVRKSGFSHEGETFVGMGVRYKPTYSNNREEEAFAENTLITSVTGQDGYGSYWFNGENAHTFEAGNYRGLPGPRQCDANVSGIECIEKIDPNGLYNIISYILNTKVHNRSCFVGYSLQTIQDSSLIDIGEIIESMVIIPTTLP
ncbi:MAG: hypothetical protein AAB877_00900, partial [Patescibacteria group bacterium]